MPFQPGSANYTQAFGTNPENVEVPHIDVRPPTSTDILYPVGKVWVDTVGNSSYTITSLSTSGNVTTASWVTTGGGSGAVATLSGDSGTASPSSGNITIAGTNNQISTTASGSTITLAATSPFDLTGNLRLTGSGGKLSITPGGAAASIGSASLVSGTVTIATTSVTAASNIFLSRASVAPVATGATGMLTVGTIVNGTSFVINAVQAANASLLVGSDTSIVNWWIIN